MATKIFTFTETYDSIVRAIYTSAAVAPAFDPQKEKPPKILKKYKALWDTGATGSAITKRVVDECNLKPIGMTTAETAGGSRQCLVYLIGLMLPNGLGFPKVPVMKAPLAAAEILIGMDIISRGDFAVTNNEDKTTVSFRIPSMDKIDFMASVTKEQDPYPVVGRNELCPCGSGKKYKKCHGDESRTPSKI